MSMFATLKSWAVKRRKLLAGVVGVTVETAVAAVPGVNIAAKFLGDAIEKATEKVLEPDQQEQVNAWLESLTTSYAGLLDRLEQLNLPEASTFEQMTLVVKKAIESSDDLAAKFDACATEVRRQTLSLGVIETKLDEHFHVQMRMNASLEEIKECLVRSPMAADWAKLRKARPTALCRALEYARQRRPASGCEAAQRVGQPKCDQVGGFWHRAGVRGSRRSNASGTSAGNAGVHAARDAFTGW